MWLFKPRYYTYHYCAMSQQQSGAIAYSDGVIKLRNKFSNADYKTVRALIQKETGFSVFVLTSLTLVGREQP